MYTGTTFDAPAPYLSSCSVNRCLVNTSVPPCGPYG